MMDSGVDNWRARCAHAQMLLSKPINEQRYGPVKFILTELNNSQAYKCLLAKDGVAQFSAPLAAQPPPIAGSGTLICANKR